MALYCGIDLHSTSSWIVILEGADRLIHEQKITNDLDRILEVLRPFQQELAGVAVESTFNWYWLVDGLMDAGYRVHLTNTCRAKQYDGLKYTDDRHDARWLAHLLALGILPEGHICPRDERSVRDLLRRRNFLVQKRSSLLVSMRGTVERLTSERVGVNDLKRWTGEGLDELVRDPVAIIGLKAFIESIRALSGQIRILEKEVLARARKRDEYPFLRSVWGIGHILAMTVMYEAGDIKRFRDVGHFASYCRCVRSEKLSNGKRKGSGNAKNGNPYLSWAFSQAAHFAVRHYQAAKAFYQRKQARRNGIVAIRAVAHKLARASYYVVRDRVVFDPEKVFG